MLVAEAQVVDQGLAGAEVGPGLIWCQHTAAVRVSSRIRVVGANG